MDARKIMLHEQELIAMKQNKRPKSTDKHTVFSAMQMMTRLFALQTFTLLKSAVSIPAKYRTSVLIRVFKPREQTP